MKVRWSISSAQLDESMEVAFNSRLFPSARCEIIFYVCTRQRHWCGGIQRINKTWQRNRPGGSSLCSYPQWSACCITWILSTQDSVVAFSSWTLGATDVTFRRNTGLFLDSNWLVLIYCITHNTTTLVSLTAFSLSTPAINRHHNLEPYVQTTSAPSRTTLMYSNSSDNKHIFQVQTISFHFWLPLLRANVLQLDKTNSICPEDDNDKVSEPCSDARSE